MPIVFSNAASSQLASAIASTDVVPLSINLVTGGGSSFPALSSGEYFYVALVDSSGNFEVMKITARSGDTLTASSRALDSTAAQSFAVNDTVELRLVKSAIEEFVQTDNPVLPNTLTVTSTATFKGDTVIGDSSADVVTVNGLVDTPLLPTPDAINNIGSATQQWLALYLSGRATIGELVFKKSGASITLDEVSDDGTLASNSDAILPTQKAVKTYADGVIPSGTRMFFHQATAPVGWTRDISSALDDVAMRVITGDGSTASTFSGAAVGSYAFTSFFDNTSRTTEDTTLTAAQSGTNAHFHNIFNADSTSGGSPSLAASQYAVQNHSTGGSSGYKINGTSTVATLGKTSDSSSADATDGHNHALDLRVKYVDVIIGVKD